MFSFQNFLLKMSNYVSNRRLKCQPWAKMCDNAIYIHWNWKQYKNEIMGEINYWGMLNLDKKSSKKVDTKSPTIFITNKIFWILNKRDLPWCSGVWIYQDIDPYMDIPDDYQLLRSSTARGLCILQFLSILSIIRPYHRVSCPSGPIWPS